MLRPRSPVARVPGPGRRSVQATAGHAVGLRRPGRGQPDRCPLRRADEKAQRAGPPLLDRQDDYLRFTRDWRIPPDNNVSERGAKAAKRHQAVSGYWHTLATLARWCRIRSYLDSAAAHGITALDAIRDALAAKPWLPPLPAVR